MNTSLDEMETSITFKCPRYLKDALQMYSKRHGLTLSPFLRMWTENELLKDMVIATRERHGFVVTIKKLQATLSLESWEEARAMVHSTKSGKVLPPVHA